MDTPHDFKMAEFLYLKERGDSYCRQITDSRRKRWTAFAWVLGKLFPSKLDTVFAFRNNNDPDLWHEHGGLRLNVMNLLFKFGCYDKTFSKRQNIKR